MAKWQIFIKNIAKNWFPLISSNTLHITKNTGGISRNNITFLLCLKCLLKGHEIIPKNIYIFPWIYYYPRSQVKHLAVLLRINSTFFILCSHCTLFTLAWFIAISNFQFQTVKASKAKSVKVHIFWEGHKILRNLHLIFVLCSASQM